MTLDSHLTFDKHVTDIAKVQLLLACSTTYQTMSHRWLGEDHCEDHCEFPRWLPARLRQRRPSWSLREKYFKASAYSECLNPDCYTLACSQYFLVPNLNSWYIRTYEDANWSSECRLYWKLKLLICCVWYHKFSLNDFYLLCIVLITISALGARICSHSPQ